MEKKTYSLTEGPIFKSIVMFAFPLLLSNLFQQLYNSIDSAVVGKFSGSIALAAVGSTGSLINLLIGFFLGIATGTGVIYSMHYGAGHYDGLKRITDAAFFLSVAAGLVITVLGIAFARPMLNLMDMPEDVMEDAVIYLRIFLAGTVPNLVYNVGAGMIRAAGDSRRPLIYLMIGGAGNLVFDLIFVALFDMGAAGAALATVAAQLFSAVMVVRRMMLLPESYRFRPLKMRVERLALWDVLRISVPCGLQGSMFNISNLLVQAKINAFGAIAMAGVTAYSKIDGFVYMPTMALSLAVSTYVGQNIGAGRYNRVRRGIRVCVLLSGVIAALFGIIVMLTCRGLLGIFTDDDAAKDFAIQMMWYLAPFAWIYSITDALGGAMRGAGAATQVTVIAAVCICVFRIVWLFVMLRFFPSIRTVFICYPISWLLYTAVTFIYYLKGSTVKKAIGAAKV